MGISAFSSHHHRTEAPLEIHPEPRSLFVTGQAEQEELGGLLGGQASLFKDCSPGIKCFWRSS